MNMKRGVGLQIDGIEEVQKALRQVGVEDGRKLMRNTMRAIAKTIAANAAENVVEDTGAVKESVKVKVERKTNPDNPIFHVMVGGGKAWYWRFIEYGTAASANSPSQPERPFVRKALSDMEPWMPGILKEEFGKRWNALMRKTLRRAKKPQGY